MAISSFSVLLLRQIPFVCFSFFPFLHALQQFCGIHTLAFFRRYTWCPTFADFTCYCFLRSTYETKLLLLHVSTSIGSPPVAFCPSSRHTRRNMTTCISYVRSKISAHAKLMFHYRRVHSQKMAYIP